MCVCSDARTKTYVWAPGGLTTPTLAPVAVPYRMGGAQDYRATDHEYSGVGTEGGGAKGAAPPPKFRYGRSASARIRNYAHARYCHVKFVESHVPKIMQRECFFFCYERKCR